MGDVVSMHWGCGRLHGTVLSLVSSSVKGIKVIWRVAYESVFRIKM